MVATPLVARAGITSTGNVDPPFQLPDTIGSTKVATVDPNGTSHGGVYVGDQDPGTLTMDNGWTLNAGFGIVANQSTAGFPSASQLTIAGGSTWNGSGDFDLGRAAAATSNVSGQSTFDVGGQFRLGTLNGANGQMSFQALSHMNAGSIVVGAAGAGALAVGGSTVTTNFVEVGRELTGVGQLILNAATVNDAGGLTIGVKGHGELIMGSGTTLNTQFATMGYDFGVPSGPSALATSEGFGTVSGAGAEWHNAMGLSVAFNTTGELTVSDGALVTSGYLEVSRYGHDGKLTVTNATVNLDQNAGFSGKPAFIVATEAGSSGSAAVLGASAGLMVGAGGQVEVGRNGSGAMAASGGAHVVSGYTILGTGAAGSGQLGVTGAGTTWAVNGTGVFEVGRDGDGTLDVGEGAVVTAPSARIAIGATSDSHASLADPGTRWTIANEIEVGGAGNGSMTVSAGARVDVGTFLYVGSGGAGKQGTVEVADAGSIITSGNQIIIGNAGKGVVTVRDGGLLDTKKNTSPTAASGLLGRFAGSDGTATVTGAGSRWTNDGGVNVGFMGNGTLNVQSGGRVDSVDGVIARLPGSSGAVTLTGTTSTWAVANSLYVGGRPASSATDPTEAQAGPGGVATLTVGTGAAVTVGSELHLFGGGTIDLTGGGTVTVGSGSAGQAKSVRVVGGASLVAPGTIKGTVVNSGSVSVGDGGGTLTIQGDYLQQSSGTLRVEAGGTADGTHGLLNSSGTVSMTDGELHLAFVNDYVPQAGDAFTFLTAGNGTTKLPGKVTLSGVAAGLPYQITKSGNSLVFQATAAGQAVNSWQSVVPASWGAVGSWKIGVPDAAGAEAQFLRRSGGSGVPFVVTLDGNRTAGSLTFDNPDGYTISPGTGGQLTLDNGGQSASLRAYAGNNSFNAAVVVGAGGADVTVDNGARVSFAGGLSAPGGTVQKLGTGTLTLGGAGGSAHVNALTVHAGTVQLAGGASVTHTLGTLTVDCGAAVDVSDGKLMLTSTPLSSVRQWLVSGYAGGAWTGSGINSSIAAANGTAVGYAGGADNVVPGLAAGSVLVRNTLYGDATLDGRVDFNDLVKLAQNYNATVKNTTDSWWTHGDFTYDGVTDFNDLVKLAQNYNTGLPTEPVPGASAAFEADLARAFASVPEPGMISILGIGAIALMRRRRSR